MKNKDEIFAEYLEGKLSESELSDFFSQNPDARAEFEELQLLFQGISPVANLEVSEKADKRFYQYLHQKSKGRQFPIFNFIKYAAVLALLAGAYFLGKSKTDTPVVASEKPSETTQPVYITRVDTVKVIEVQKVYPSVVKPKAESKVVSNEDITNIYNELTQLNRVQNRMILAMLRQESASDRIHAINQSRELDKIDQSLVEALFQTLENDPSVNVRLAAVDAIGRLNFTNSLRENLVLALQGQSDPSVQWQLISQLIEMREVKALPVFAEIINRPETNERIRNQAEFGMNILNKY